MKWDRWCDNGLKQTRRVKQRQEKRKKRGGAVVRLQFVAVTALEYGD